jgi:SAM-dependent methyltransferase
LFSVLGVESVVAVDVSRKSLEVAERNYGSSRVRFIPTDEYKPGEPLDLVFCNGVFHHIPLVERAGAMNLIHDSLRADGLFALWENNPWNPVTQLLMGFAAIDRDAIKLMPSETRRLLNTGGFEVMQTDFMFIFPRLLRWFRVLEPRIAHLALGLQYQVLSRKKM